MALNFPGPLELRINYSIAFASALTLAHQMRLNFVNSPVFPVSPGDPFSSIVVLQDDGGTDTLANVLTAWVNLVRANYANDPASTNFIDAECWQYEPGSFDAQFISAQTLGLAGTGGAGTNRPAEGTTYVFRTAEGGIMKVVLLEALRIRGVPVAYGGLTVPEKAMVDYVMDTPNTPWLGRDTSRPISFKAAYPGEFEKLWEKRYRS